MALSDARKVIMRASGIFDSKQKEMLYEMLEALGATSGGIESIVAGDPASVVGDGDVTVSIDSTDPVNPVVNLAFVGA